MNDIYDFHGFHRNQWPPVFDTIPILQSLVIVDDQILQVWENWIIQFPIPGYPILTGLEKDHARS
jgi:hypothetical protein